MSDERKLIEVFFTCFQQRDWRGMIDCCHPDIFFYDPVFQGQEGARVRAMWEMLLTNANDLVMTFSDVRLEPGPGNPDPDEPESERESFGSCHWVATYTFAYTGRRIINKGRTWLKFRGGKIIEQQDYYSFWKWCRQALGIPGILFGWTPFIQNKIRRMAKRNLEKFLTRTSTTKI